jgi:hypothetical protein
MATKTFATEYIRDKAEEAIVKFKLKNKEWLAMKQQLAIQEFRNLWISILFRKNWTDQQVKSYIISHTEKCGELWCTKTHYPTSVSIWNDEIRQLLKIKNLADTYQYGDEITITDEEWKLLTS